VAVRAAVAGTEAAAGAGGSKLSVKDN